MSSDELIEQIRAAIVALDEQALIKLTDQVEAEGRDPITVVNEGYTVGIKLVGEMYEKGEFFLPELVKSGRMVKEAVARLERGIPKNERQKRGVFLIGTVEGDIHDIGKDLVATMLASRGVEVVDIGVNNPTSVFIERALEVNADIIGASCLLTSTIPELPKLIGELSRRGLRDRFKVMMGGAALERSFVEQMGADGYGEDLKNAADVALELLSVVRRGH
ncbi:MAG: cobalamin-dependent protein [Dehalococcoidales bacterium]|nr:cobalamin-dependent protein [Dehalococcoidales bacterium]